MSNFTTKPYVTPDIGSSLRCWARSFWMYRAGAKVPFRYKIRAWVVTLVVIVLTPFRLYEWLLLRKKVTRTLVVPPVFIIGHWRSGTTHIHNLLAQDPQFGYVTHYACMFPHAFVTTPLLPRLIAPLIPKTRPMDKMALSLSSPQEEELALSNIVPYSFFAGWHYPKLAIEHARKVVTLDGLTGPQLAEWQGALDYILKKNTLVNKGKRLILKNPPHTARVAKLLERYPGAKFIFIHRNPYEVFSSTIHFHHKIRPQYEFEQSSEAQDRENVLAIYDCVLKKYLAERDRVPKGDLIEVAYSELDQMPLQVLERVYRELGLTGFAEARAQMEAYLDTVTHFEKNHYELSPADKADVQKNWHWAFEAWGYQM